MKVLHVLPYYAPAWTYGGVVRAATDLTRALVTEGHSVYVLTTDTFSPSRRIRKPHQAIGGVHVYRVPNISNSLRGRLNLSSPMGIRRLARRLIREHEIDVIHCHELRTVENLRIAPLANRLGVPLVVSPHGTLPTTTGRRSVKTLWDYLFARRLLKRFDRVIALTPDEAEQARRLWSQYADAVFECSVVPNGIHIKDFDALPPTEPFRTLWKLGSGPVVLFLGRLHERKGVQVLIPAFADAVKHAPDARLLVVGPDEGMRSTLEAQVGQYNLAGRVIFTGLLTGQDKLAALAAADLFALPADGEGFSMAVLEAMACGLPVLLTPGCHFPAAADEGAGLVVPRAVEPVSAALSTLLTDRQRRASMGRRARELVSARYTWPHVVAQMIEAYEAAQDTQRSQRDTPEHRKTKREVNEWGF